jgi:signal transduction histidine kinase
VQLSLRTRSAKVVRSPTGPAGLATVPGVIGVGTRVPWWRVFGGTRHDLLILVWVAFGFGALDATLYSLGTPAQAGMIMQLTVDASLVLLLRFPGFVTGYAIAVSVAMLASEQLAPGLLVPLHPVSLMTVPAATPVITANLPRLMERRRALLLVGMLALLASRPWAPSWSILPFGLLSTAVPALAALYFEARKQLVQSLRDRAERAEREQELLAERARAEERRRLAAEMHDVVTHRLSLIVLHAGAMRVTSPGADVRAAADEIRAAGTQALDELRDLVGVLRDETSDRPREDRVPDRANAPDPESLITESRSTGMSVEFRTDGDADGVSPTVGRTAYRVVQEALTNVRKHAPGAEVRVELRYRQDGLRIEVRNSAATEPADPVLAHSGSGAGLHGLRQRVELIGGSLRGRPVPGGGYRLDAILPAYVPTAESPVHDSGGRGR